MVVFEDEASLSNTATVSYKWEQKGRQPKKEQKQRKRERKTLFGCVDPKTGRVISQVSDKGNSAQFFSFLIKVCKDYKGKKVYMILDNVPYHHSKRIKAVLQKYTDRIELVFLPPYSPDLNPIERIWWFMRKSISHNRAVESLDKRLEAFQKFVGNFAQHNQTGINLCNICSNIY